MALDLFGDADTRRASRLWRPIGMAGSLRIDAARVLEALRDAARPTGDAAIGWIPGSGFEGQPDLLAAGAGLLPLIGTPPDAVRSVRDPGQFFEVLAAHGIEHPPVRAEAPPDPAGWLAKDAGGHGGWHIRDAAAAREAVSESGSSRYFQRTMPGVPMSATFIANGREAMVGGVNELIVRPFGVRPYVYAGCIGPVDVTADLARRIAETVRTLTAAFGLRGWCSLDFLRDGDTMLVLEVNPRPPASLALYPQRGLIDAQIAACLHGKLPPLSASAASTRIRGSEIVYAQRSLTLSPVAAQHLAGRADVHDRPVAGACFDAGDPVCSLSAEGDGPEQVKASLHAARDALRHTLETLS
ncbi:MAG TPA: ATP-grasp domain-containing protein [Burkholderiaceae bacterium]